MPLAAGVAVPGARHIACGLALAPVIRRPDILVGHDAQLIAVRGADDRYAAVGVTGSSFELQRWLEHDGDIRPARDVSAGDGFRCDAAGCTMTAKGQLIAIARHASALTDDCTRASVLVVSFPSPPSCRPKGVLIDFFAVRRKGTHAIFVDGGSLRIATVADERGDRPWSRDAWRGRSFEPPTPRRTSRLAAFAAPLELVAGFTRPRPENEDDDGPMIDEDAFDEARR